MKPSSLPASNNQDRLNEYASHLLCNAQILLQEVVNDWAAIRETLSDEETDYDSCDLFADINTLQELDELRLKIQNDISRLEDIQEKLTALDYSYHQTYGKSYLVQLLDRFVHDLQKLKEAIRSQADDMEDLQSDRAEKVLLRTVRRIESLIGQVFKLRKNPRLADSLSFNLDYEMELREIYTALEDYRAVRAILGIIPDDVLNLLESAIVACDNALLIDESSL